MRRNTVRAAMMAEDGYISADEKAREAQQSGRWCRRTAAARAVGGALLRRGDIRKSRRNSEHGADALTRTACSADDRSTRSLQEAANRAVDQWTAAARQAPQEAPQFRKPRNSPGAERRALDLLFTVDRLEPSDSCRRYRARAGDRGLRRRGQRRSARVRISTHESGTLKERVRVDPEDVRRRTC